MTTPGIFKRSSINLVATPPVISAISAFNGWMALLVYTGGKIPGGNARLLGEQVGYSTLFGGALGAFSLLVFLSSLCCVRYPGAWLARNNPDNQELPFAAPEGASLADHMVEKHSLGVELNTGGYCVAPFAALILPMSVAVPMIPISWMSTQSDTHRGAFIWGSLLLSVIELLLARGAYSCWQANKQEARGVGLPALGGGGEA